MLVRNVITECDDDRTREIPLESISHQAHHRLTFSLDDGGGGHWDDVEPVPDDELTGIIAAKRFRDTRRYLDTGRHWRDRPGAYTGGEMPYGFLGLTNGGIDQCLEVADLGPHARRWSWISIATAWVGNFNLHPPTEAQWETAVPWTALWMSWSLAALGHSELPGGSSDPNKRCPGEHFDMHRLRLEATSHELSRLTVWDAERELTGLGVVF